MKSGCYFPGTTGLGVGVGVSVESLGSWKVTEGRAEMLRGWAVGVMVPIGTSVQSSSRLLNHELHACERISCERRGRAGV